MPIARYFHKFHLHTRLSKQKRLTRVEKELSPKHTHTPADGKKCGRLIKCVCICVRVPSKQRKLYSKEKAKS